MALFTMFRLTHKVSLACLDLLYIENWICLLAKNAADFFLIDDVFT